MPFLPASFRRLLDVGCSEGSFGAAELAERPGVEVWGLEPHPPAAAAAKQRLTHLVVDRFSEEAALTDAHFDVITFNDSLEHMPDEQAMLKLAHRKLRSGGTLICSVPNVRYLENVKSLLIEADWRYTDAGILDRTHLRFFTCKSIRRAVEESGFAVQRIEGIHPHHWSGWKIGLLRAMFGRHIDDMRWTQFVVVASRP